MGTERDNLAPSNRTYIYPLISVALIVYCSLLMRIAGPWRETSLGNGPLLLKTFVAEQDFRKFPFHPLHKDISHASIGSLGFSAQVFGLPWFSQDGVSRCPTTRNIAENVWQSRAKYEEKWRFKRTLYAPGCHGSMWTQRIPTSHPFYE